MKLHILTGAVVAAAAAISGWPVLDRPAVTAQTQPEPIIDMHMHALALVGLERATAGAFRVYPTPIPATK